MSERKKLAAGGADSVFDSVRFVTEEGSQPRMRTSSSPFYGLEANPAKHKVGHSTQWGSQKSKSSVWISLLRMLRRLLDGCLSCVCCCLRPNGADLGPEVDQELLDSERESVQMLLQYLDSPESAKPHISNDRLRALCVLAYSDNTDLQRSAALCFAEISERMKHPITQDILNPLIVLLRARDVRIQQSASLAITNFAIYGPEINKTVIMEGSAVQPMINLLSSKCTEIQCNACAFVTTMASSEPHQKCVVNDTAMWQLLKLSKSKDLRVLRNSTGALLNLTHTQPNRDLLVQSGALPVLVEVLHTPDQDTRYYCTAALSNLAISPLHRTMITAVGYNDAVVQLIKLISCQQQKVVCQACLALRNLASDTDNQLLIVRLDGLKPLHKIIQNGSGETLVAALACLRNLSMHIGNEPVIIRETFVSLLIQLLRTTPSHQFPLDAITHAAGTVRNLAAGSYVHVLRQRGCIEALLDLCLSPNTDDAVLAEATAALAVLSDHDEVKESLLSSNSGALLSRLAYVATTTNSSILSYNCAGTLAQLVPCELSQDTLASCTPIILRYLEKVLHPQQEASFLQLGLWTIIQLLRYPLFSNAFHKSSLPSVIASMIGKSAEEEVSELLESLAEKINESALDSDRDPK